MLPHMNLLGFFHTEKPKKKIFEQPKTPKPQNPVEWEKLLKIWNCSRWRFGTISTNSDGCAFAVMTCQLSSFFVGQQSCSSLAARIHGLSCKDSIRIWSTRSSQRVVVPVEIGQFHPKKCHSCSFRVDRARHACMRWPISLCPSLVAGNWWWSRWCAWVSAGRKACCLCTSRCPLNHSRPHLPSKRPTMSFQPYTHRKLRKWIEWRERERQRERVNGRKQCSGRAAAKELLRQKGSSSQLNHHSRTASRVSGQAGPGPSYRKDSNMRSLVWKRQRHGSEQDADQGYQIEPPVVVFWCNQRNTTPLLARSLIAGRRLVPDFIVKLDGIFQGIVLIKSVIGPAQLLHCTSDRQTHRFCLNLGYRSAGDVTAHVRHCFRTRLRRLVLHKRKAKRRV